jgi:cytochrome c biogenesis factor
MISHRLCTLICAKHNMVQMREEQLSTLRDCISNLDTGNHLLSAFVIPVASMTWLILGTVCLLSTVCRNLIFK